MNKFLQDTIESIMYQAALEVFVNRDVIEKLDNVDDRFDAIREIVKSYIEETR